MRDIMLYPIQMPYLMYENDKKRAYTFEHGDYVKCFDNTTNEKLLYVRFGVQDGAVRMKTYQPLTYIYAGKTQSMSIGAEVTIPLDHDVVLRSASVTMPRIKVRVVKLDDPRAPTPPQAPQAPRTDGLPPTLPTTPEPEAPPQVPKPQKPKRQKRQKRQDFYMVA